MLQHPNVTSVIREPLLERTKRDFLTISSAFNVFRFPKSKAHRKSLNRVKSPELVIPMASGVSTSSTLRFSRNPSTSNRNKQYGPYSKVDPMWRSLWYINRNSFDPSLTDMNITSAWKQGFSGKGVSVTFLDDGLEWVSSIC